MHELMKRDRLTAAQVFKILIELLADDAVESALLHLFVGDSAQFGGTVAGHAASSQ